MRCLSAAQAKPKYFRKGGRHCNEIPRAGTRLREVYDLLQASRGEPVNLNLASSADRSCLISLENFYGLDIRPAQRKSFKTGAPCLHILAGEWFGKVYVDYIAEHLEQHQSSAPAILADGPAMSLPSSPVCKGIAGTIPERAS